MIKSECPAYKCLHLLVSPFLSFCRLDSSLRLLSSLLSPSHQKCEQRKPAQTEEGKRRDNRHLDKASKPSF